MKAHSKQSASVPASEPEFAQSIGRASAQPAEAPESEEVKTPNSQKNETRALAASPGALTSSQTNPINGDALAYPNTNNLTPENAESSPTETALVAIGKANAIDRIPVNSAIENIQQEEFSQTRLDQLCARWDERDGAFWVEYAVRCELV